MRTTLMTGTLTMMVALSSPAFAADGKGGGFRAGLKQVGDGIGRITHAVVTSPQRLPGVVKFAARWGATIGTYGYLTANGVNPAIAGGGSYIAGEAVNQLTITRSRRLTRGEVIREAASIGGGTLLSAGLAGLFHNLNSHIFQAGALVAVQGVGSRLAGVMGKFGTKVVLGGRDFIQSVKAELKKSSTATASASAHLKLGE